MKVVFEGSPAKIKNEMKQWLSDNNKEVRDLDKFNFIEVSNRKDMISVSYLRKLITEKDIPYAELKAFIETNKIKQKRSAKCRYYVGLKLKEENYGGYI